MKTRYRLLAVVPTEMGTDTTVKMPFTSIIKLHDAFNHFNVLKQKGLLTSLEAWDWQERVRLDEKW